MKGRTSTGTRAVMERELSRADATLRDPLSATDLGPACSTGRILVVDDEEYVRSTFADVLRAADYVVDEVGSGEAAIAAFGDERPDLVLLDLLMPHMDGFAVSRAIRGLPGGATVPIVIATGLDDHASIAHAFEVGATEFITKPVPAILLIQRTHRVLRWSRALTTLQRNESRLSTAQRIARVG